MSPAAQRLRYFRFTEYVLVFVGISAVSWLVLFFILLAGQEAVAQFGTGFSVLALSLGILASVAAIYFGVMAYRGAGKLRPAVVRRYTRILPLTGLLLIATETVICVRFLADGKLAVTRSTRRSKDAYELAAELAHLDIIGSQRAPLPAT